MFKLNLEIEILIFVVLCEQRENLRECLLLHNNRELNPLFMDSFFKFSLRLFLQERKIERIKREAGVFLGELSLLENS